MGHSALAFIVVIGILVFIHEFGHFIVARLCGVGVQTFSLGFGPKLFKRKLGRTEYCVSAIPFGGYVKMVGDEPGAPIDPDDIEESFTHKSLFRKSLIVAAGPFSNFFLAVFLLFAIFLLGGVYLPSPIVGKVVEKSPAMAAGIQAGDVIKKINQKHVESFEDIFAIIGTSNGQQVDIVIERNGQLKNFSVMPELKPGKNNFGEDIDKYIIGIIGSGDVFHKEYGLFDAMHRAVSDSYMLAELTILSVVKMVTGSVSSKNLGGPIMIAQMAGEQARAGIQNFAFFIALLSVNLGIINLFPIPVLDGGHLLFFGVEAITGKSVNDKVREKMIQFGAAMLVALMVFVFYNDIVRLVNGG